MSLSISISSSLATANTNTRIPHSKHESKPMSISSITTPLPTLSLAQSNCNSPLNNKPNFPSRFSPVIVSSSSSPKMNQQRQLINFESPSPTASSPPPPLPSSYYSAVSSEPSSPDSPTFKDNISSNNSTDSHHHQNHRYHPYSRNHSQQSHYYEARNVPTPTRQYSARATSYDHSYPTTTSNRSLSISSTTTTIDGMDNTAVPLTVKERRQRNKAASAKYRAKKNQQHGEMRMVINSLSKENNLIQRQLEHARRENYRLKDTCDKLRGKIMAEKMLKKLLNMGDQQQQHGRFEEDSEENEEDEQYLYEEEKGDYGYEQNTAMQQALKRFDEDIDSEDDDDDEKDDI